MQNYLDPNEINDTFLKSDHKLAIFQNNVRSVKKNFHLVEEIFQNCKNFTDILSLTETRLNEKSALPSLHGYSFEHVDSTTECGGVGVFNCQSFKLQSKERYFFKCL